MLRFRCSCLTVFYSEYLKKYASGKRVTPIIHFVLHHCSADCIFYPSKKGFQCRNYSKRIWHFQNNIPLELSHRGLSLRLFLIFITITQLYLKLSQSEHKLKDTFNILYLNNLYINGDTEWEFLRDMGYCIATPGSDQNEKNKQIKKSSFRCCMRVRRNLYQHHYSRFMCHSCLSARTWCLINSST